MAVWVPIVSVCFVALFASVVLFMSMPVGARVLRVPVCSTARLKVDASGYRTLAAWEQHSRNDLITSPWMSQGSGKLLVLAWRLALLGYFIFGIAFEGLAPRSLATGLNPEFLTFFTNWTFVLFGLHACLGITLSSRALLRGHSDNQDNDKYDWLSKLAAAVFATTPTCSLFLAAFYWIVLYNGAQVCVSGVALVTDSAGINYEDQCHVDTLERADLLPQHSIMLLYGFTSHVRIGEVAACCQLFTLYAFKVLLENPWKHGGSVGMLAVELWLSNMPITSIWIIFPVFYATLYVVFMWIYWAASDVWVYDQLNFEEAKNIAYYVALPFLIVLSFWIIYGFIALRQFASEHCMPAHKLSNDSPDGARREMELSARPERLQSA